MSDWGLDNHEFWARVDNWFNNFDAEGEKKVALKIFSQLDYYSPSRFNGRIKQLTQSVERHLYRLGRTQDDVVLVTPEGAADSADRHAYDVVKEWRILRNQVVSIDQLDARKFRNPIFVVFNDTHGSGNQFLRDIWSKLGEYGEHSIYVLAISIAEEALQSFRQNAPNVHVIPHIHVDSARTQFNAAEFAVIEEIGRRVYPPHPLGYGATALNVAYYFQCPNNTLPVVWADGDNNLSQGSAYPWNPLFPYNTKPKREEKARGTGVRNADRKKLEITGGQWHNNGQKGSLEGVKLSTMPDRVKAETSTSGISDNKERTATYRYRISLLDFNGSIINPSGLIQMLNDRQGYFQFSLQEFDEKFLPLESKVEIYGDSYFDVTSLRSHFFSSLDSNPVDASVCLSKLPLAFDLGEGIAYNYFSGPSPVDKRFLFVSIDKLDEFSTEAAISLDEAIAYIVASQLAVYFTENGYHREIEGCPMDFCERRDDMIKGLRVRRFCRSCRAVMGEGSLLDALTKIVGP